mgnify:CR=1 FL=1|jgi:hypothetical protein|tara:strand:+ start:280 stop:768 length:489 start_codon:yes stop_codon:yes gene_type:complete
MYFQELDNFLTKQEFLPIKEFFTGNFMPWYYNKHQTKGDTSFFSHRFYWDNKIETYQDMWQIITPIINKLKASKILRVKANLTINKGLSDYCNYHVDSSEEHMVAVYYITTCNGFTSLGVEDKIKIKCKENKMVIFDGKIKHSVVSQTDEDQRIVININFIK